MRVRSLKAPEGQNIGNRNYPLSISAPEGRNIVIKEIVQLRPSGAKSGALLGSLLPIFCPSGAFELLIRLKPIR
jgi:hypothetical protein